MNGHHPLLLAAAAVLGVLGVARATRLWVYDAWPPVAWARGRFLAWAEQTRSRPSIAVRAGWAPSLTWRAGWAPLATCPFCVAPWFALGSLTWAWCSGLQAGPWATAWWFLHAWFAVAYVAAMVVVRDEPSDD